MIYNGFSNVRDNCHPYALLSIDTRKINKETCSEILHKKYTMYISSSGRKKATGGFPRQKQSLQQVGALVLLIFVAFFLSIGEGSDRGSKGVDSEQAFLLGIIPAIAATVVSGLASSLCQ